MKTYIVITFYAGMLLLVAGCGSSSGAMMEATSQASSEAMPEQAFVYVLGEQRAVTPGTVRIRRDFGENEIEVRDKKGNVVRTYVVEMTASYNQNELVYSYWGNYSEHMPTYFVKDLNMDNHGNVVIPYFPREVAIRDDQLDLTMLVGK